MGWCFWNFQFMPSTIKNYAIDYNNNSDIELKEIDDSLPQRLIILIKLVGKLNDHVLLK